MSRADKKRWRSAENLQDLGTLVASWLIGDIGSQPGYTARCGPDEETQHLLPVLVAVNRIGFVTDSSQPGVNCFGVDGRWWEQRAAVSGLVGDRQLRDRLVAAAETAGLLVVQHDMSPRQHAEGIPVTRCTGRVYTAFGRFLAARDLLHLWRTGTIGVRALGTVLSAWQLTLIDPVWGRDDVLWEALTGVVRQYRLEAVETKAGEIRRALSPEHPSNRYEFPDRALELLKEQLDTELDAAVEDARLSGCTDTDIDLITRST
ncbi:hypothetical protein [Streptomyces sp. NPDC048442]|uniref:DUF6919 domain-containing protein n=1 Tax=Streptomyces sp. NPDC048442 TaxID=3154823 RepID=UPI003446ACB8